MQVIRTIKEMQAFSSGLRREGRRIAFVPTMGFLHEGHLSLMRLGRQAADDLIVSIFVNPIQFGEGEDFEDYPRNWEGDLKMITAEGAACLFAPPVGQMYPQGFQTKVSLASVTKNLCGLSRPTHFDGVTTVVAKLFNAVMPHCAVFGEKDFQQLMVIKRMVRDLNMDVDIIGAPIVRESDGLALSSRNKYLTAEERTAALGLSRGLAQAADMFAGGERNAALLIERVRSIVEAGALGRPDYIKVCDFETLEDIDSICRDAVMALAVFFGRARLIDNVVLKMQGIKISR